MKTKTITWLLAICSAILILLLAFSLSMIFGIQRVSQNTPSVTEETFLLKNYQGKLALYIPPADKPKKIYNIYLSTLPDLDQKRLEKGIYLDDLDQVNDYLEDFDS